MSVFVTIGTRRYARDLNPETTNIDELLSSLIISETEVLPAADRVLHLRKVEHRPSFYVLCNGKKVSALSALENGKTYHIIPRLLGGKGGFGSMLRAIGAQIEKTTSREACRDLSGRRMRDINNEKKLKDWLAKEADREREKEERRQERLARRSGPPQHKFDDAQYHEQRSKVQEDLEDALQKGLKRAKKNNPSESSDARPSKRSKTAASKELLGVDIDSDDLQSDSDNEANPGSSEDTSKTEICPTLSASYGIDETASSSIDSVTVKEECDEHLVRNSCSQDVEGSEDNNAIKIESDNKEEVVDSNEPIDLQDYSSCSELAVLGLNRLKNALMVRGLKCGGTLEERAGRLFSIKGLTQEQIDPSLFAKLKGKGKKTK